MSLYYHDVYFGIPLYNVWFGHRLQSACPDTTYLRAMVPLDMFHFEPAVVFSLETMATNLISGLCDESITRLYMHADTTFEGVGTIQTVSLCKTLYS
jgi:hypothetical protein